jgi:hypothetical protein
MGTDISFSEAVQAIVLHHCKLYELLLSVFPAYRGECEMPPRENRASRILDCEKNDAHRLLENLATAAKAKPRGPLASAPDTLIAECRDFLAFLETNLPSPDCSAAISDICQIEEAFVNFIKGVSGGDPSMTHRAYSLRIDKFVRDMKASFRSLGHSIVKLEYELTQFRFLQKAKLVPSPNSAPEKHETKGFSQHDRKILSSLHRIEQTAVYGKNPTDSQRIGNIRREQVRYGVNRYKPASGRNKGYSASKAAMDAIRATEFKNKPGAYTDKEKRTLAQAILRAYNKK